MKKITQEYLKEALTYDPDTGVFTWNERPISHFKNEDAYKAWNAKLQNVIAGTIDMLGYHHIKINGKRYFSHRLAFLYMEGYLPENHVDHIDRNPSNNKWGNLREVSAQCNQQNCSLAKNNTSGVTGVSWDKKSNKWVSQITFSRKVICLGCFENFDDAVMARYQEEVNNPLWSCSTESSAYKYLNDHNLL